MDYGTYEAAGMADMEMVRQPTQVKLPLVITWIICLSHKIYSSNAGQEYQEEQQAEECYPQEAEAAPQVAFFEVKSMYTSEGVSYDNVLFTKLTLPTQEETKASANPFAASQANPFHWKVLQMVVFNGMGTKPTHSIEKFRMVVILRLSSPVFHNYQPSILHSHTLCDMFDLSLLQRLWTDCEFLL